MGDFTAEGIAEAMADGRLLYLFSWGYKWPYHVAVCDLLLGNVADCTVLKKNPQFHFPGGTGNDADCCKFAQC